MHHWVVGLFALACCLSSAAAFDHVIDIPPATSLAGLKSNTQVNVFDGANLSGFQVPASLTGVEVNVFGGRVQSDVLVNGANQLNVFGGSIGHAAAGRSILVTGGEMAVLEPTHSLSLGGGRVGFLFAQGGALSADVYGGNVDRASVRNGATATIRGGRVGLLNAEADALTTLRGGDFRLNGLPVVGPLSLGANSVLTGVLEDGSSFVYVNANSQIQLGDWLAGVALDVVDIPAAAAVVDLANDPVPNGLRAGQTLLASAGDDLGDNFHANSAVIALGAGRLGERAKLLDTTLTIDGGAVGRDLLIYPGSEVVLRSGSIASFLSTGFSTPLPYGVTSSLTMSGGVIGSDAPDQYDPMLASWMEIEVDGGQILTDLRLFRSTMVQTGGYAADISVERSAYEISGGVADDIQVRENSTLSMHGGAVRRLRVIAGKALVDGGRLGSLSGAAQLNGQFELDGVAVTGPTTVAHGSVLTGVLADGSTLAFSPMWGDALGTLTLVSTPVPPATPAVINAPVDAIPNGVRAGQVLTLGPGADAGHDFVALGATLNIAGGVVGDGAVVVGGTTLLSSGSIGGQFTATDNAVVVVSGGSIGPAASSPIDVVRVLRGSSLSVAGGSVPGLVLVDADSSVNAVGGVVNRVSVGDGARLHVGGTAQVSSIGNASPIIDPGAERTALSINGGTTESVYLRSSDIEMVGGYVDRAIADADSIATVQGGTLGALTAYAGGRVTLHDGEVLRELRSSGVVTMLGGRVKDLRATGGGVLDFEGGVATGSLLPTSGVANLVGGRVENASSTTPGGVQRNQVSSGGVVNLSGSEVRGGFLVSSSTAGQGGGVLDVTGGVFGRLNVAQAGATVRLHGADFALNGQAVSGHVNWVGNYVLTGTLADGTVVILSSATEDVFAGGTLELVPTAVPAAADVINSPSDPAPRGLRAGQTLNLGDGVSIGYHFAAVDATLNMTGGSIDYGMELLRSEANLDGGTVGDALMVHSGSTVNINGALVGDYAIFRPDTTVTLDDGRLGGYSTFQEGSSFLMTGGALGYSTTVRGDAVVSGGVVGRRLVMNYHGSNELRGAEFRLNGNPVSGVTTVPAGSLLTGVLSDGTPVLFGASDALGTVTITETEVPEAPLGTIVSPAAPAPRGLRSGQSLVLQSGATTVDDFTSLQASLVVDGGRVGNRFEAQNSRVDLRDGAIGPEAALYGDTVLTVRGGSTRAVFVHDGATLSQIGGELGAVNLWEGATLNVGGGDFNGQPPLYHDFWAPTGSTINLFGLSFTQNGVDLLAGLGLGESVVVTDKRLALDGVLADGSEFGLTPGGRGQSIAGAAITLTKLLLGDFNHDGVVDAADYTVWRDSEGQAVAAGTGADHDLDGLVTATDREVWAANYGRTFAETLAASVPEPAAAGLVALAGVISASCRLRGRKADA